MNDFKILQKQFHDANNDLINIWEEINKIIPENIQAEPILIIFKNIIAENISMVGSLALLFDEIEEKGPEITSADMENIVEKSYA
jgi:hypothetical protein